MDSKLKNAVIDAIVACAKQTLWYPSGEAVRIIYEGTVEGSLGRRLVVDMCAAIGAGSEKWSTGFENCPREFLLDALKATVVLRPPMRDRFWGKEMECYHEDEDGEEDEKEQEKKEVQEK